MAVARIPCESRALYPSRSPAAHREDIAGSRAVRIDTAKIAWGSWNRMNAAAYDE